MIVTATIASIFATFGACIGSFLNVCIYRMPQPGLSISEPRTSFCPSCRSSIRWFDNIPILSWLALKGRCRACKQRISIRYPLVEALTAALFALAVVETGSTNPELMTWLPTTTFWALLFAALVVVSFIDIDHRIIPDEISITGSAIAPFMAWLLVGVPIDPTVPAWVDSILGRFDTGFSVSAGVVQSVGALAFGIPALLLFRRYSPAWDGSRRKAWDARLAGAVGAALGIVVAGLLFVPSWLEQAAPQRLVSALLGMAVGAGSLYGVGLLGKLAFRKDAMGLGDVKLMALLGAVLGWKVVLLAIFVACLIGSVVGIALKVITRSSYIPFGPFLAVGALILILWGDWAAAGLDWYLALFRPQEH